MSEMVERVARTLEKQAWVALGCGDTLAYQNRRTSSLRKARAAIEAMREPTTHMEVAGTEQWLCEVAMEDRSGANWRAMIDAALKE